MPRCLRYFCVVTYGLNIIAVRVQNKRTVIIGVINFTDTGWAIVAAPGNQGRGVEAINCSAITGSKSDMDRRRYRLSFVNPEQRLSWGTKPTPAMRFLDNTVTQYGKGALVKFFTQFLGTNFQTNMIEHHSTYEF